MQDIGLRVQGSGCRIKDLRFGVYGIARVYGIGCKVYI
jgi:hypothetical protein